MAGHSKWANIKHRKGKQDSKKAQVFTKFARAIAVSVREGGADPMYNATLAGLIDKAKSNNMPNDNIDRAIKKGAGELGDANFEEVTYEGYGPSGIAVLVKCLTDNRNRTAADVRYAFDKYGGNLGSTGCVAWMFDRKGLLIVDKTDEIDEEQLMLEAIDAGAEDFSSEEGYYEIITDPENFTKVRDILKESGYVFSTSEITYLPQSETKLEEEKDLKNMVKMIDTLEDSDDVQEVFHNWDMPEDLEI